MCQKKWNNTLQLHKSCKAFMESKTDEHKKCMFMWLQPLMIYVYEVIMTKKCLQMIMLCRLTAAVNCSRSDEHIFFSTIVMWNISTSHACSTHAPNIIPRRFYAPKKWLIRIKSRHSRNATATQIKKTPSSSKHRLITMREASRQFTS